MNTSKGRKQHNSIWLCFCACLLLPSTQVSARTENSCSTDDFTRKEAISVLQEARTPGQNYDTKCVSIAVEVMGEEYEFLRTLGVLNQLGSLDGGRNSKDFFYYRQQLLFNLGTFLHGKKDLARYNVYLAYFFSFIEKTHTLPVNANLDTGLLVRVEPSLENQILCLTKLDDFNTDYRILEKKPSFLECMENTK